jgi:ribonuclease R
VFRLTDRLSVRLARVDLDERKIDFEPAESAPGRRGGGQGERGRRGRRRRG